MKIACRLRGHLWSGPVIIGGAHGDEVINICRRCKARRRDVFALPMHLIDRSVVPTVEDTQ